MLRQIIIVIIFLLINQKTYAIHDVDNYLKNHLKSGVALVVNNNILYHKAFGFIDCKQTLPMQLDSKFPIASLSKNFTAAAILKLSEEKLLSIDNIILIYLPVFKADWADKVSIHQLLNHTSGVPNYLESKDCELFYKQVRKTYEWLKLIENEKLEFEPGTNFKYSGSGYNLLSAILEKVSGVSYGKYLRDNFFIPLKLNNTFSAANKMLTSLQQNDQNIAQGCIIQDNKIEEAGEINFSSPFGEASIISTAIDLYNWQKALYVDNKVINQDNLKKMLTNYGKGNGYGIFIKQILQQKIYYHQGRINGFETYMLYSPTNKLHIILLSNNQGININKIIEFLLNYNFK